MVKNQQWIELKIPINPDILEPVSNYLFEQGSTGCLEKEIYLHAYFNKDDWNETHTKYLIEYLFNLKALGLPVYSTNIEVGIIDYQDWNALWKKSLKPIQVLPDLIIKPTWYKIEHSPNTLIIEIDPQMAFGSGVHATTQLMIKLMKKYLKVNQKIIDIGTGSGILAIIAAKLSKSQVIACDLDPIASETAFNNIKINNVQQWIRVFTGTFGCLKKIAFDLILANINRNENIKLLSNISEIIHQNSVIILSGILIDEEKLISDAIKLENFKILETMKQDEWLGLVISK